MSGGNGLLGMSLSAPVLADAVHRVRPGSVASAFDGATTCAGGACAPPRRPSTRPIDRRWDKSRGIVFSSNSSTARPTAPDHTWSRAYGIVFGQIPASTRSYALDPRFTRKQPTATNMTNKATSAAYSIDDAHRSFDMGMTLKDGTKLREEINGLKKNLAEREAKILELTRHSSKLNEEMKQLTADFILRDKNMDQQRAAEKSKLEAELTAQKRLVAALDPSKQNLDRACAAAREEGRRAMEVEMRQQYDREVELLKASHARQRQPYDREVELLKASHARERQQHGREVELLKASHAREIATFEEHSQVAKQAKSHHELLVVEHARQKKEYEEAIAKVDYLQRQYHGRKKRAMEDRDNYHTYHNMFDDMFDAAYDTMSKLMSLKNQLESEAVLWRKSATTFENVKTLHLFRQQSKYSVIKRSISDFLQGRHAHAKLGSENVLQLATKLWTDVETIKTPAHNSRTITRLLHFDDVPTAFGLADATYSIAMVLPFRQRRDECDARIAQIIADESTSERSGQLSKSTLLQELRMLRQRRSVLSSLLHLCEIMRKLKAYEALLQDNPVEKAVFMRTTKVVDEVAQAHIKYSKLVDKTEALAGESGLGAKERLSHRSRKDDDLKAKRALEKLQDLARNRCVLEQELGQLTSTEQNEADQEIRRRMTTLVEQQNGLIDRIVPSMRQIGRQSRLPRAKHLKQVNLPSMEDMKSKLAGSLAAANVARPARHLNVMTSQKLRTRHSVLRLFRERRRLSGKRRKIIASPPNADEGAGEMSDETMAPILSKIAVLKSESKAAQIADGPSSNGDSGMSQNANGGKLTSGADSNQLPVSSLRKRCSRRSVVQKHLTFVSGTVLNLKPTGSKCAQHSLFASTSFDVRGCHQTQEAERHVLDEAFSTVAAQPKQSTVSPETMCAPDDGSAHHARDPCEVSTKAASASAKDHPNEDDGSEYSPSQTSVADFAADAPADESSDVDVKLAYNIPTKDYRAAVMASSQSSAAFWSHRLYKDADGNRPAVFYCKNFEVAERQARLFADEKVLGFDLEWEPQTSIKTGNIKRNVSLIQIAAQDKIALFQVALFKGETAEELMPPTLKTILESADVVKAGVNVVGDARRVRELLKVNMKGVFELSHLYRVVKYSEKEPKNVSFKLVALASQVQDILMLPLKKDDNRVSAWSRELHTQQTDYAASDAYAGFRLYHKLDEMRKSMSPVPPIPGFLEQELPLTLGDGTKVYKSTWKASERKATTASKNITAEEEEDEFFDAVEDQDADLIAKMDSLDIGREDGTVAIAVTYPALSTLDTEETAEHAKASGGAEVAQNDPPPDSVVSSRQATRRPDTSEVKAADAWVADWRSSRPPDWTVTARPFELRAYHLWHHQGFALKEVAALCREPPLALTTVASYVMQALKEENLPYDPERVRDPRDILPTSVHRRYQKIFDRIPK